MNPSTIPSPSTTYLAAVLYKNPRLTQRSDAIRIIVEDVAIRIARAIRIRIAIGK